MVSGMRVLRPNSARWNMPGKPDDNHVHKRTCRSLRSNQSACLLSAIVNMSHFMSHLKRDSIHRWQFWTDLVIHQLPDWLSIWRLIANDPGFGKDQLIQLLSGERKFGWINSVVSNNTPNVGVRRLNDKEEPTPYPNGCGAGSFRLTYEPQHATSRIQLIRQQIIPRS